MTDEVDVGLAAGVLRGRRVSTPDGRARAFLGVPFRRATERFRPGLAVEPWTGVHDATVAGPAAPQATTPGQALRVDEAACLNLSIWTPDAPASARPVIVWVHGGLHVSGSNADPARDGARLAAYGGVIVIAINYRLGALGFLAVDHLLGDDYRDSGDLALLDIVAALGWVRENVGRFGGDPANVTVVGQSAGATMVAALLAAPAARGLFRRAIMQSGDPERVATRAEAESVTAELLDDLGIADRPRLLLDMSWRDLVAAQHRLLERRSLGRPNTVPVFRPLIGGPVLPLGPVDAITAGASSSVDLIVGTNVNEASGFIDLGSTRSDPVVRSRLERELVELLPQWQAGEERTRAEAFAEAVRIDRGRVASEAELLEACLSERLYRRPSRRLLDARRTASGTTRSYLFAWKQPDAVFDRRAGHSLELPFLFRHLDDTSEAGRDAPTALRDAMSTAWASFAATGEPGAEWPTYDRVGRTTLVLDLPIRTDSDPLAAARRLVARR